GAPACHLLASARVALAATLLALRHHSGRSQVVIPAYTCPTVVQSVLAAGLEPVLCDMSTETFGLDSRALESKIGDQVLAVVPVHLYGLAQDVRGLVALGDDRDFFVVEDAAQAYGARFQGRMVGTWGHAGIYSMGRGKCMPAGHGGIVVAGERCADAIARTVESEVELAAGRGFASLPLFAGYGLATRPVGWWFVVHTPLNPADEGMDYADLPPIQMRSMAPAYAGLGFSILRRLPSIQDTCRQNAGRLMDLLARFDFVRLPYIPAGAEPVFLRLPFIVDGQERARRLFERLWSAGTGVSRSYYRTLAELCAGMFPSADEEYPGASELAACLLTLPTHPYLADQDFSRIARAFYDVASEGGKGARTTT
ncbi:MAG TPA: DegT/DnrJ/EryC1/StrS family aminotransferase, partial [Anaerolineae bacterium]|nr:DegT/DnrJ/EryC1/StrS family aminotransferase [Anaerolineae bacterium]